MKTYVLGIDPGFGKSPTGCALLDLTDTPRLIEAFELRPHRGGDWQRRVDAVLTQLNEYLVSWKAITLLCYALPHLQLNPQTALRLADLGGGVRGLAAAAALPCIGVQEAESKVALASRSDATKADMIAAAWRVFGRELSEHESDAIGHGMAGEALWHRANVIRQATGGKP